MKKQTLLFFILFSLCGSLFAQQITRIAVVDYSRILENYYENSRKIKELEEFENEIIAELSSIADEITALEEQKIDAQRDGDEEKALKYDAEIEQKKQYQQDYYRVKKTQLENLRERNTESLSITAEIYDAIVFVSEREGFSFVMKKSDPDLVWWSPDVDITDAVLSRLAQMNR